MQRVAAHLPGDALALVLHVSAQVCVLWRGPGQALQLGIALLGLGQLQRTEKSQAAACVPGCCLPYGCLAMPACCRGGGVGAVTRSWLGPGRTEARMSSFTRLKGSVGGGMLPGPPQAVHGGASAGPAAEEAGFTRQALLTRG